MHLTLFFREIITRFFASARLLTLVPLLLACGLRLSAQGQATPTFTYAAACGVGAATSGSVRIAQSVLDAAGNTYLTGDFYNSATFDAVTLQSTNGTNSAFVVKLNPAGAVVWARQVDGYSFGAGIAVDAGGNVFVTGGFAGAVTFGAFNLVRSSNPLSPSGLNLFVAKLSPAGTVLWAVRAGSNDAYGEGIAIDAAGCSYVCGAYSSGPNTDADFGPFRLVSTNYAGDAFVTKLDPTGAFLWVAGGGGSQFDEGYGIALDATGSVYITGGVSGGPGGVARFGSFTLTTLGDDDILVAKLSPAGVFQWATSAGGPAVDRGQRIAVDALGMVHVVGYFMSGQAVFGATTLPHPNQGTLDAFVGTLTPAGVWQWAINGGGPGDDYGYDLAVDAAGNTYAVGSCSYRATFGSTVLTTPGDLDVFVCKIDPAGAYVWAVQAGGTGRDEARGVALSAAGTLTLAGDTRSSLVIFGTQGFTGTPPSPMGFVARLATGPLSTTPTQRIPALALWPSPARGGEVLHLAGLTTRQPIEVLDMLGRVVLTVPVLNLGTADITLPASLGAGVYLVRAGHQQVGRVTVQ